MRPLKAIRCDIHDLIASWGVDLDSKEYKRWVKVRRLLNEYAMSYCPPRVENMRKDIAKVSKKVGEFKPYPES